MGEIIDKIYALIQLIYEEAEEQHADFHRMGFILKAIDRLEEAADLLE